MIRIISNYCMELIVLYLSHNKGISELIYI